MRTTASHAANVSDPPASAGAAASSTAAATSLLAYASVLAMGTYLGIIFVKSEVACWQRIHDMFLFREPRMYLIIGLGIAVAMVSMWLIKRFEIPTIEGAPIRYVPKPFHWGVVLGGMLFGAGWAITGACPGPVYAQIGSGAGMAWFTFAGALAGMFAYASCKAKLPH